MKTFGHASMHTWRNWHVEIEIRFCTDLRSVTELQVQGRDVVFKSILYSHVILYWLLVASACCAASEADLHPLTAIGLPWPCDV